MEADYLHHLCPYGDKGISGGYLKNICAVILRAMNYMKKKQLHEITVPENPVSIRRQSQVIVPREQELARLMYFTTNMSYIS